MAHRPLVLILVGGGISLAMAGFAQTPMLPDVGLDRLQAIRAEHPKRAQMLGARIQAAFHRGTGSSQSQFRLSSVETDRHGITVARFEQMNRGIRVWDGAAIARMDATGQPMDEVFSFWSPMEPPTLLQPVPRLNEQEIRARFSPISGRSLNLELVWDPIRETRRVHRKGDPFSWSESPASPAGFQEDIKGFRLCYWIIPDVRPGDHTFAPQMIVDATTGEVLRQWGPCTAVGSGVGNTQYGNASGNGTSGAVGFPTVLNGSVHSLSGRGWSVMAYNPATGNSDVYTSTTGVFGDFNAYAFNGEFTTNGQTAAADVHFGFTVTNYFFSGLFYRDSIDGGQTLMPAYVHTSPGQASYNTYGASKWFVFGDSVQNGAYKDMTAINIVSHEWAHALNNYTANVGLDSSSGDSAGLNESNSDFWGAMVQLWHKNGMYPGQIGYLPSTLDPWVVGQWASRLPFYGFRHMAVPDGAGVETPGYYQLMGHSPKRWWIPSISGWESHDAAGPMNRFFYLATSGFQDWENDHTSSGYQSSPFQPYGANGIGPDTMAQIWYHALTQHITPGMNQNAAAQAAWQAAGELYGSGSSVQKTIAAAARAVNYYPPGDPSWPDLEPNDTPAQATLFGDRLSAQRMDGELSPGDPADYLAIHVPDGHTADINLGYQVTLWGPFNPTPMQGSARLHVLADNGQESWIYPVIPLPPGWLNPNPETPDQPATVDVGLTFRYLNTTGQTRTLKIGVVGDLPGRTVPLQYGLGIRDWLPQNAQ